MAVVVESHADQAAAALNHGIFPVPPGVAEDNAKQAAKEGKTDAKDTNGQAKPDPAKAAVAEGDAKEAPKSEAADDVEGEDGLTEKQRREYTASMLKTIGKKHRMQKEAEEFAAAQYNERKLADERASKLEADLAALREQLKPAKVEELKEPARADFKDDQGYWDAMVDFRVDKKMRAAQAEQAQRDQENFQRDEAAHAQAKMDRGLEHGPEDFKEVFEAADIILPTYVLEAVKTSDLMPELVYFLGVNRDKAEAIAKLTDGLRAGSPQFIKAAQRQLVEIGKIESTLKPFAQTKGAKDDEDAPAASVKTGAKPEPETGSIPSKPRVIAPVIRPLNGGSASQVAKDETEMSTSEVISAWQKKHRSALTVRKRH